MRANRFVTSLVIGAAASVLSAQSQAPMSSDSLRNRLERAYPLTEMDTDGSKVVKPGTILVIQQDGIQANSRKFKPFANKYEDGKVSAKGLASVIPGDIMQAKTLAIHDKVYLTGMEIRDEYVMMTVQSCGGCDPAAADPGHKPHWASIQFKFIKGYLTSTDLTHIRSAIGSLLAPAYPALTQTTSQEQRAPAQPQPQMEGPPKLRQFDDIPPPPPVTGQSASRPTLMRPGESLQPQQESAAAPKNPPAQAPSNPTAEPKEVDPRPEVKNPSDPAPKAPDKPKAAEAADREIQTGWPRDKVNSVLGTPLKDQKSGGQEILIYPHTTVTLEKGRVVAVANNI